MHHGVRVQQELRDSYPSDGATRTSHTHAGEAESIKAKEAKKTERAERERSVFVDD